MGFGEERKICIIYFYFEFWKGKKKPKEWVDHL